MSQNSLFLTGPLDGELRALQRPLDLIQAAVADNLPLHYDEAEALEPIVPKCVIYTPVKVAAFGRYFLFHAPVDATEHERNQAALRHFLSDKGRGCVA